MLRLKDTFIHHSHLCLVFELLSNNLYELIKQNSFRGLTTSLVRVFTAQLLDALTVLNEAKIIHCDLKPENILLKSYVFQWPLELLQLTSLLPQPQIANNQSHRFWLSMSRKANSLHLHSVPILSKSRSHRLATVLDFDRHVVAGLHLCRAVSRFTAVSGHIRIQSDHTDCGNAGVSCAALAVCQVGANLAVLPRRMPPDHMLDKGKQTNHFFEQVSDEYGRRRWRLKSLERYAAEFKTNEQPSKKYFSATTLPDIIKQYPIVRKGLKESEVDKGASSAASALEFR